MNFCFKFSLRFNYKLRKSSFDNVNDVVLTVKGIGLSNKELVDCYTVHSRYSTI